MSGPGSGGDGDDPPKQPSLVPLRQEIEGVLEEAEVPAEKRELVVGRLRELVVERYEQIVLQAESYEGDLPHPRLVAQYEQTLPGAAERIFVMAEKRQAHEHSCEKDLIEATRTYGTRGQYIGAFLIVLPIGAAFYCAITGHPWQITGLFVAPPIIAGAVAFVNRQIKLYRDSDDDEPNEKKNDVIVASEN